MLDFNQIILIFMLLCKCNYITCKKQIVSLTEKQDPTISYLQQFYFKCKVTDALNQKGGKIYIFQN